jgi:hypothetical protein
MKLATTPQLECLLESKNLMLFQIIYNMSRNMKNNNQKIREEIGNEIFHGIPSYSVRKKMTPEKLAILLSECEKNSPKYYLIQHELNIRIVKKQSKPVYISIFIGFLGIMLGWILGQWEPFKAPVESIMIPECVQKTLLEKKKLKEMRILKNSTTSTDDSPKTLIPLESIKKNHKHIEN